MHLDTSQGGSVAVFAADTRPCPQVVEHASGVGQQVYEAYAWTVKRSELTPPLAKRA